MNQNIKETYRAIYQGIMGQMPAGWQRARVESNFFDKEIWFEAEYLASDGSVQYFNVPFSKQFFTLKQKLAEAHAPNWGIVSFELRNSGQHQVTFGFDRNSEPVVGRKYYKCVVDYEAKPPEPLVETFLYLGYAKRNQTSDNCDTPYHFHKFATYRGYYPSKPAPALLCYVPSRKLLTSFAPFPLFMQRLEWIVLRLQSGLEYVLPNSYSFSADELDMPPPRNE